ncbi:MAG: LysR family transcriptional regulator, partial [Deltaproteobacteria bacterium]|nr:LysR family transcriptional regulator [Deltaproteobacteria bacterium]
MREKQIAGEDRSISAQPPSPAFDLNLFRVFSAVYRLGSQGQAARALQLSQPAVSHALARLREQLGGPLFTRVGQGAVPTPLAHAIVRDVDQALQLLGQTVAAARGFSPATSRRRFRVGTGDALEQALVVEIFIAVAKLAPAVALDSVPCGPEEIPELIVAGEIDIGLGVPVPHGDRVCHRVVAREPVLLAMRRDHPLARGPLTIERWLAAEHLVVTGQTRGATIEDLALQKLGIERRVARRCQTYQVAGQFIAQSNLVAVV